MYQDCGQMTEYAKNECPNLIRYMNKIQVTYWPDWNENVSDTQLGFFAFFISTLKTLFF